MNPDGLNGSRPGNEKRNRKKDILEIATWNVKTMLQPGKMLEIIKEAAKVNIDVLAIQETRWAGQGRIDKQNYSVFYSGPNTRTGQCGTGCMISANVRKNLMSFIPLGDRLRKVRPNVRVRNITLISV